MLVSNYKDRFEIAITPMSDIDTGVPDINNNITTALTTLWRFKRNSTGTGTIVTINQNGQSQEVEKGMLEVWDMVQVGNYVLAWVNEVDSTTEDVIAHHIVVLELIWTLDIIEDGTLLFGDGYDPNNVTTFTTQGQPGPSGVGLVTGYSGPVLSFKQINLVELTNYHLHSEAEGNRINVSSNGQFAVATGGGAAGAYLLYLGGETRTIPSGYPKIVGGLHLHTSPTDSSIKWRGWPLEGGGLISDELAAITSSNRAGCKPEWPLDGSPQFSFNNFPSNCAVFHESNEQLYLFLQTEPMSVWYVDQQAARDYATSPNYTPSTALDATKVLHFVAALEAVEGRFRKLALFGYDGLVALFGPLLRTNL